MSEGTYTRRPGEWPAWIDDILRFGPIAELDAGDRSWIAAAIVEILDFRTHRPLYAICPCCGVLTIRAPRPASTDAAADEEAKDGDGWPE